MKNILFLLLIFVIKSNAYEYLIFQRENATSGEKYEFFTDERGRLQLKLVSVSGYVQYNSTGFYLPLDHIKYRATAYVDKEIFDNYYKNDLTFLNDLYKQQRNPFLNYLYNQNRFTNLNYINYENYELLYNSDGLLVESIVNEVWAGLYSNLEKDISGKLYSVDGQLLYNNGKKVDWFGILFDKLTGGFGATIDGCFYVLGNCVKYTVVVFLVWLMFYLILRLSKTTIK